MTPENVGYFTWGIVLGCVGNLAIDFIKAFVTQYRKGMAERRANQNALEQQKQFNNLYAR